jgi:hypothetical protein
MCPNIRFDRVKIFEKKLNKAASLTQSWPVSNLSLNCTAKVLFHAFFSGICISSDDGSKRKMLPLP